MAAYDCTLRCSHLFNVLDARGAIGVTERQRYILRVRDMAFGVARAYLDLRRSLGYPLLGEKGRALAEAERAAAEAEAAKASPGKKKKGKAGAGRGGGAGAEAEVRHG
jgi:glycyl-tRNA synthetase alpha chain